MRTWLIAMTIAGCGRIHFDATSSTCASSDAAVDASVGGTGVAYYVATTGDDARTCAEARAKATPRKTIGGTFSCLASGDTLLVRGGVYAEELDTGATPIAGGTSWDTATRIAAYPGETPIVRPAVGAQRVLTLQGTAAAYIVFDGFVFDNTNGNPTIDTAVKITAGPTVTDEPNNIRLIRCEVLGSPVGGIYINHGTGHELIELRVHDNIGDGINVATSTVLVERCDIHDNGSYGILIYDNVKVLDGNVVRDNLVHSNGARAMYVSHGDSDEVSRNVAWGNNGGLDLYATSTTVVNNTFVANVGATMGYCATMENTATGAVFENNICWQHTSNLVDNAPSTAKLSNLFADPGFVDEVGHDFDLVPGSAAIDTGTILAGTAYAGTSADIGAFEQPVITAASLACERSRVHLDVQAAFDPIEITDCAGITMHDGAALLPLTSCRGVATGIDLELAAPARDGAALTVDYASGATDSLAVGGTASARLRPLSGLPVSESP